MPYTIARPSPAPCAGPFVVKNGSNAWLRVASSIPMPVSSTSIVTYDPGATSRIAAAAKSSVVSPVRIVSVPPRSIASRELIARFTSTCSIWLASATTSATSDVATQLDAHRAAQHAHEQPLDAGDDLIDVEQAGRAHLLPAEDQQLTRERGAALDGVADVGHLFLERIVRRERLAERLGRAEDHAEEVVDVVRDAAGESSHRVHLLARAASAPGAAPAARGAEAAR